MKIAVAGDSAGEGLAHLLAEHLKDCYEVFEVSRTEQGADPFYANMADRVASAVRDGVYDRAILICGTGIGVSISANKVRGIRAALVWSIATAELAREHNNANVIAIGARQHTFEEAVAFIDLFIATPFTGEERHARRIGQLAEYEHTGAIAGTVLDRAEGAGAGSDDNAADPEAG